MQHRYGGFQSTGRCRFLTSPRHAHQYEWNGEIHRWPSGHKWYCGQSQFWPSPQANAKSAADELEVLMLWVVGFIVCFLTDLLSSVRSLPVLNGRSRQINAQIVQLSEGIGNYLPQFLHSAPSNKFSVGRVYEWLGRVLNYASQITVDTRLSIDW
jgi:hypothetical protein